MAISDSEVEDKLLKIKPNSGQGKYQGKVESPICIHILENHKNSITYINFTAITINICYISWFFTLYVF